MQGSWSRHSISVSSVSIASAGKHLLKLCLHLPDLLGHRVRMGTAGQILEIPKCTLTREVAPHRSRHKELTEGFFLTLLPTPGSEPHCDAVCLTNSS